MFFHVGRDSWGVELVLSEISCDAVLQSLNCGSNVISPNTPLTPKIGERGLWEQPF
jgi:hypothetical protein